MVVGVERSSLPVLCLLPLWLCTLWPNWPSKKGGLTSPFFFFWASIGLRVRGNFLVPQKVTSLGTMLGPWSLPLTKSGQRVGAHESLVIDDPWLVQALANYVAPLAPGDYLRTASPGLMRTRLKDLLSELHLGEGYQWYSCRRGGATYAFRTSNNLSHICFVGRWNHIKTARVYLTDALAQLTEIRLEPAVSRRLLVLARKARPHFSFDA